MSSINAEEANELVRNTIQNMKNANMVNIDEKDHQDTMVCSIDNKPECTTLIEYIKNLWEQLFGQQPPRQKTLGGKKSKSRKLKTAKKQKKRKTIRRRK